MVAVEAAVLYLTRAKCGRLHTLIGKESCLWIAGSWLTGRRGAVSIGHRMLLLLVIAKGDREAAPEGRLRAVPLLHNPGVVAQFIVIDSVFDNYFDHSSLH